MFFGDKKKAASVILSKMHKDGSTTESDVSSESGEHNVYRSMAEDMISAFKDGSVNRLEDCLKAFHDMIKDEDEEQDEG